MLLSLSIALALSQTDTPPLERIVVTGARPLNTIELVKDPKAPQQPLPAQDGADYLKAIPGFNLIRKGGTSGDPVFRGAAGSRLTISSDDQMVLGGCSGRMDPPTAYINPQNYDQIRVIKGPQTVLYGPAAGTVLFERKSYQFDPEASPGEVSTVIGSFGRIDGNADYLAGNDNGFWRINASYSESDDYRDGNGTPINSAYQRWGVDTQLGWTPDQDTVVLLTLGQSGAEAAYADRMMDGAVFDRTSASLRWRESYVTNWLAELDSQVYFGYVDHVMDNYSLREFRPTMRMPNKTARNPDRYSRGGRMVATIDTNLWVKLQAGLDHQYHSHRERVSMNQSMMPYQDKPRIDDAIVQQTGLFSEASYALTNTVNVLGGVRVDWWEAKDLRPQSVTRGAVRNDALTSAFVRSEINIGDHQLYVGVGRAERFPDFWELIGNNNQSATSTSAFHIAPELTHQLDLGYHYRVALTEVVVSAFYNNVDDYILIEDAPQMQPNTVRSVNTESFGGEVLVSYRPSELWLLDASLAYTHGSNLSDHRPLAQQPPLELKLGAEYKVQDWTVASLWRVVANQHRVAIGQGNIAGSDFKETAGFGTLALNAHRKFGQHWRLSFGVDNLFDKAFAEHLSTAGAAVSGYEQITQVNEPGRTYWLKLDYQL
ncbi:TonB-dependent copper receptor [Pseudidiomarina woesei]|uniref:TonB-dependent copper receptor n=1 Tax=Pseudidiomarina woesei TaxID=1381080 RepID=A0A0K6H9G6_9GAMM|nr:TonB-dependent copper receptor [Pseudidiomarina woesei]CUA87398.1 TonB-dependent copper receptor [Pseudidiomarina woesei]